MNEHSIYLKTYIDQFLLGGSKGSLTEEETWDMYRSPSRAKYTDLNTINWR
jgi:hypothetical protein